MEPSVSHSNKYKNQKFRRKQRAHKIQEQRKANPNDSGEEGFQPKARPPRPIPKKKKSKMKEPDFEEDIIDGFTIMSFQTYEELEVIHLLSKILHYSRNMLYNLPFYWGR